MRLPLRVVHVADILEKGSRRRTVRAEEHPEVAKAERGPGRRDRKIKRAQSRQAREQEGKDDQAIQRVQMVDASGDAWLAIYSLQLQKDKTWRITGCNVVPNKGRMA